MLRTLGLSLMTACPLFLGAPVLQDAQGGGLTHLWEAEDATDMGVVHAVPLVEMSTEECLLAASALNRSAPVRVVSLPNGMGGERLATTRQAYFFCKEF